MNVFATAMDRIYANPSMAVAAVWISATTSEERPTQRDAIAATANANGSKAKRQRKGEVKLPLSDDEKAAFYAKMVNADGYLPQSVISNTIRDAMLARGLVTPERLRLRGVR